MSHFGRVAPGVARRGEKKEKGAPGGGALTEGALCTARCAAGRTAAAHPARAFFETQRSEPEN